MYKPLCRECFNDAEREKEREIVKFDDRQNVNNVSVSSNETAGEENSDESSPVKV